LSLTRLRIPAAILLVLAGVQIAAAQTVSVVSGNGQVTFLANTTFQNFEPLSVKVTDSSGSPVSGGTVTWALVSGDGGPTNTTTTTNSSGVTSTGFQAGNSNSFGSANTAYYRWVITATYGTAKATFYLTRALIDSSNSVVQVLAESPTYDGSSLYLAGTLSGKSGKRGTIPVLERVAGYGAASNGVPNVSVRLVSTQSNPSVACVTGSGADVGSVLTDATGNASCTPVFSGSGTGTYNVLVGGVASSSSTGAAIGYQSYGPYPLTVTTATPGKVNVYSGGGQTGDPGAKLTLPLVAQVLDSDGDTMAGQAVTWSVSPSSAATLSNSTTTTDENGKVSTNVTFASAAVGVVQITATLASKTSLAATFSETVTAQISSLSVFSGSGKSAIVGRKFTDPLVVRLLSTTGAGVQGYTVQFTTSGSGSVSLSSSSVVTDSNGKAEVTATAGTTAGAVTVTATVGTATAAFNLTVIPAGPVITSSSFYNAADMMAGNISPCGMATLTGTGLATGLTGFVNGPSVGPLPYTLNGVSITVGGYKAPIARVGVSDSVEQVTFQVPCEVAAASSVPVVVGVSGGSTSVTTAVLAGAPGVYQAADPDDGIIRVVAVRSTGEFVTAANPARRNEYIRVFATGLGTTLPAIGTNLVAVTGADALVTGTVHGGIRTTAGSATGIMISGAKLAPDMIGVYEIPVLIPATAAQGSNVIFSLDFTPIGSATAVYSGAVKIPVL
jgi:uncharacterized protein (TIGR03437 family)